MDAPISAFAVYNASRTLKTADTKNKKKKTKNKRSTIMKDINKKIGKNKTDIFTKISNNGKKKKKRQLKQTNEIVDTAPIVKKKRDKRKIMEENKILEISSESEDVPKLVPALATSNGSHLSVDNDDACSHESNASFDFIPVKTDSAEEGHKAFKWMISPFNIDEFFIRIWEKKPLHIARKTPTYYQEIISTPLIDDMLRNENIQYTKNIDVTSYINGQRQTHNSEGRAYPNSVWDSYLNGCSIRLLNPQTYMPKLHLLNATLQEFFNSFVGANAYLTPPDSQGFAPHYDDIEAFILQVEGKKQWRVYKPHSTEEILPRISSKNFNQDEIGSPVLEVVLEAGDMLYFPRGYIHQGITIDGEHSLHVTVSMYQKHSWADLFEKMLPAALHIAINENVELRHGLPFDIYDLFGLVHSDVNTPRKVEIRDKILSLFEKVKNSLPIDEAVDQMAKNYQNDALPPVLSDLEKAVTVHGDCTVMVENGKVINRVEISLDTKIRLLRKNILRMVSEDNYIRLYYYAENSLEYHGFEVPYIEIDEKMATGIETLITSYPEYVSVENLDIADEADKLQLTDSLWARGLIMTEYPLDIIDDE